VRKQKFFKSGQEYFEQGKYREAALHDGVERQLVGRGIGLIPYFGHQEPKAQKKISASAPLLPS